MKKRLTLILASLFMFVGMALAQTTANGVVVFAEDNEPIIGATVKVVGSNKATVTDASGRFSIDVPNKDSNLEFTYVGMITKTMKPAKNMHVVLASESNALDEVMVVAFGTQKKSSFTGSAAVVDSKELDKKITTNIADALVGSVAGLQIRGGSGAPGAGQGKINIRGIASLYAETDPLIIVDGAPYSGSLSNIPQNDIESITVLKDAASAALYGARGAAGVIIVTTKRGKTPDASITVDMRMGANTRAIQDYETITNPAQFYEAYYMQLNNYYLNAGQSAGAANLSANNKMISDLGYNVFTIPTGQNLIGMNGRLNPNATMGRAYDYNGETYFMQADDWQDAAYKTAQRQEYVVSANGKMDRGSYYTSVSYLDEDGVIEHSGYERVAARVRADYQAKNWLKFGANVGYTNSRTESNANLDTSYGSTNLFYYTSMIAPIYPIYVRTLGANGKPVIRTDANGNPQYDYGVASTNYGVGRAFLQTGNPLGSNHYNKVFSRGQKLSATGTVDVQITNFLSFNSTNTVDWGHTNYSDYENALYGPKVGVNGQIDKSQTDGFRQNYIQTLNFYKDFGKHSVTALAGHEWYKTESTYLGAVAQGLFSPEITEINAAANKVTSSSYTSGYNVEGFFGSAQYSYDDKYFGSASFRRDASSRFAKGHQWGNFWSVGGAWLLNKEAWFNCDAFDQLKVKASIGQQGNDNIGNWAYVDLYSLSASSLVQMSPSFYRIGNENITWETTTNANIGVEMSLWKGRLTGNIDFYNKKTTDLLFWLSVPESAGSRGYYGNIGDIRNRGIEVVVAGDIIRTKNINWNLALNASHNSTKILSLPESKTTQQGGFYEGGLWYEEGAGLYNYMTYSYAGVDPETGKALYWYDENLSSIDKDGNQRYDEKGEEITNNISKAASEKSAKTDQIGYASRYASGSILPKLSGGFTTTVNVYGFDFSASFDYQLGGKIYDSRYASLMTPTANASSAGTTFHKDIFKSWNAETNPTSEIPRWCYADLYTAYSSDRFLTSSNYLNFQSFTVGYTLPKQLTSKLQLNNVRIYCTGENLCFWSARKGLDPRYAYDANETLNTYSPVRTIMGGIQVQF